MPEIGQLGGAAEGNWAMIEESRHRLDMVQTCKRLTGKERVKSDTWFQLAGGKLQGAQDYIL